MGKPAEAYIDLLGRRNGTDRAELFAEIHYKDVSKSAYQAMEDKINTLGLSFAPEEIMLITALSTPELAQKFLHLYTFYNNDHEDPEQDETAHSPRQVMHTGSAHCFEAAAFVYTLGYLHGWNPRLVLLESRKDSDHNIIVYQGPDGRWGSVAQSQYDGLSGRDPIYESIGDLAASYKPYYYSGWTDDSNDITMVGYSDPIDLVVKYGVRWMSQKSDIWEMYYTYIDGHVNFHYLSSDTGEHLHASVTILKNGWVNMNRDSKIGKWETSIDVAKMPQAVAAVYNKFWQLYILEPTLRPTGEAKEIEREFIDLTGMNPIDVYNLAWDFREMLEQGIDPNKLLMKN